MSVEHKAALAAGRAEGRAVRNYLESLEQGRSGKGRARTSESIESRLSGIDELLESSPALERLKLLQERRDLQQELEARASVGDSGEFEEAFIQAAKAYSDRKGISYATWREAGVSAAVLKAAGVQRTRS